MWVAGRRKPSANVASGQEEAGGGGQHRKSQVAGVREATEQTEASGNWRIGRRKETGLEGLCCRNR